MENNLTLYGASGHCKVIIDILESNAKPITRIIDDNKNNTSILGKQVVHSSQVALTNSDNVILSIGNNKVRKMLSAKLSVTFVNAIHPKSILTNYTTIGEGTVIMAGVIINPEVKIGKHCILNTGAIIEHDCDIHDFAHISPNASLAGGVIVGEGAHVGIGASVIQGVKIGKWAVIGAGAVIINDVPDYSVVVGNPGKVIKQTQNYE